MLKQFKMSLIISWIFSSSMNLNFYLMVQKFFNSLKILICSWLSIFTGIYGKVFIANVINSNNEKVAIKGIVLSFA